MKFSFIIVVFLLTIIGSIQGQDIKDSFLGNNPSVSKDSYQIEVEENIQGINDLLASDELTIDTLVLESRRSVYKADGSFLNATYSTLHTEFQDSIIYKEKMLVYSYEGKLVKVCSYFDQDINIEKMEKLTPFNSSYSESRVFYFDNEELIFSSYGCNDSFAFIGSCGGVSSHYENYFKDTKHYKSIINGGRDMSHCTCGYNFIVPYTYVQQWIYLVKPKHPDYNKFHYLRIDHEFDNYKTPEIIDAELIINTDTIQFVFDKDSVYGYGYPINKELLVGKLNIKITHPDYEILGVDSALMNSSNLYMFKKGELFFIENGMPISLKNGMRLLSIKFYQTKEFLPNDAKELVNEICKKYKLEIDTDFRNTIEKVNEEFGPDTSQKMFGCLEQELYYTFWLKKQDGTDFENKNKRYQKIRKTKEVEWLGIPLKFSSNILGGIEIEFKNNTDLLEIERVLEKYNLVPTTIDQSCMISDYMICYIKLKTLIPSNDLMKNLMKEGSVKYARPLRMIYELCE